MKRLTANDQILIEINAQGTASTKQLKKVLPVPEGTISSALFRLRKEGLIEHAGYSRWKIADKGQLELDRVLPKLHPAVEATQLEWKQKSPSPSPTKVSQPAPADTFWRDKFVELAFKLADKL